MVKWEKPGRNAPADFLCSFFKTELLTERVLKDF